VLKGTKIYSILGRMALPKISFRVFLIFGILFGLLYGLLTPETFTSYKAQSVVINGATNPMTDAEIENTLGVDKYLPHEEDEEDKNYDN
jgi:hypothetical protein